MSKFELGRNLKSKIDINESIETTWEEIYTVSPCYSIRTRRSCDFWNVYLHFTSAINTLTSVVAYETWLLICHQVKYMQKKHFLLLFNHFAKFFDHRNIAGRYYGKTNKKFAINSRKKRSRTIFLKLDFQLCFLCRNFCLSKLSTFMFGQINISLVIGWMW